MKGQILVLAIALCLSAAAAIGQTTQPATMPSTAPSDVSKSIDHAKAAAQTIQDRAVTTANSAYAPAENTAM